jgi:hypothetical protein
MDSAETGFTQRLKSVKKKFVFHSFPLVFSADFVFRVMCTVPFSAPDKNNRKNFKVFIMALRNPVPEKFYCLVLKANLGGKKNPPKLSD